MNKFLAPAALALLMAAGAWPAQAQSDAADRNEVAKVRTDEGVIMLSVEQGAFNTAAQGQRVATGDRLMVAKGGVATVVYDNGCERKYDKAGVYEIDADCAAGWWARSKPVTRALVIGGGTVLAAAIVHDHNHRGAAPVSR